MTGVAVTGMGCVTPLGNSIEVFWDQVVSGRSGISEVTRFDTSRHEVHIAGEIKDFAPEEYGIDPRDARRFDRFVQYGIAASVEAMHRAGLAEGGKPTDAFDPERTGAIIGTGIGGLGSIEDQTVHLIEKGPRRVSPTLVPSAVPDVASNEVALKYGLQGPTCAVSTACSSGNDAMIYAVRCIREGIADIMVAGGAEATVTQISLATFGNLKALSRASGDPTKICRPFDKDRSGFVMGEGSGILVLESIEHAKARGAEILAVIAGYGQTCDSYHRTAPHPDGAGAARAIRQAIAMAQIEPTDVDYINAHGTSTLSNDPMETRAIKSALGEEAARQVAISSTKSMHGHLIGATGGIEAIVAIQALRSGVVPPTINLDDPDPECDLDYVPHTAREKAVKVALSNTFGFGGHNATVAFRSA